MHSPVVQSTTSIQIKIITQQKRTTDQNFPLPLFNRTKAKELEEKECKKGKPLKLNEAARKTTP